MKLIVLININTIVRRFYVILGDLKLIVPEVDVVKYNIYLFI